MKRSSIVAACFFLLPLLSACAGKSFLAKPGSIPASWRLPTTIRLLNDLLRGAQPVRMLSSAIGGPFLQCWATTR